MSYGDTELKRTINEKKYLFHGLNVLGILTIGMIIYNEYNLVMFIPHILFVAGWFIIPIINEKQDYKNTLSTMELLNAQCFYMNCRLEALKI